MHSCATLSQLHWNISTMTSLDVEEAVLSCWVCEDTRVFVKCARPASARGARVAASETRSESLDQEGMIVRFGALKLKEREV